MSEEAEAPTVDVDIRCGKLFDGSGSSPLSGGNIHVRKGRISGSGGAPASGVIDLGNYFVQPAFIDCHTHLSMAPWLGDQNVQIRQPRGLQALRVPGHLQLDLAAGVGTMRIMGEEDWLDVYCRETITAGVLDGPRLYIAGKPLAPSNGHGRGRRGYDGADAVRQAARENLAQGADFLKVFVTGGVATGSRLTASSYSPEELRAAVEEAERAGSYVAAHAHGGPGLREAVDAGARTIEHASLATDEEIDLMLERGCRVVMTFGIFLHPRGLESGIGDKPMVFARLQEARERIRDRAQAIFASSLPVAFGTDSVHGAIAFEVQTAITLGLDPRRALAGVTGVAAAAIGVEDEVGLVAPGRAADIIALDGDPLVDPSALDRVVFIMQAGRVRRAPAGCGGPGLATFESVAQEANQC